MNVLDFISKRSYIKDVIDNRGDVDAPCITVQLNSGYFFKDTPDADTQSFANLREACAGSSKNNVFNTGEDAKKATPKAPKAKKEKVQKVAKASKAKAPKVEKVVKATKTTKALSTNPKAVAERARRAAKKAAAEAIVADALVS